MLKFFRVTWWLNRLTGRERRRQAEQQAAALKWLLEAAATSGDGSSGNQIGNGPLISIIMPVWNRAATVRTAIDSVLSQTYTRWKLVVVDDGSMDGTNDVLAEFAGDVRVRVPSGSHEGVC